MKGEGVWTLLVLVVTVVVVDAATPPHTHFSVYWNVPSEQCHKFGVYINVSNFGLVQNAGDKFRGDKVTILYQPGLFPRLKEDGTTINGGIPQRGSLIAHAQAFLNNIHAQINPNFTGVAVLDFEDYYPSLAMSPQQYRKASWAWVTQHHPHFTPQQVHDYAQLTFNNTAQEFFQLLLWVGREARRGALWGYYHYPYCHNYQPGQHYCNPEVTEHNDHMGWLVEGSRALYPSLYLMRGSGWDPRSRRLQAWGRIREALRTRRNANKHIPILPYFWYRYHDADSYLDPLDVVNTLGLTRVTGLQGAVVWGKTSDVDTPHGCLQLKRYAETQLGPLVQYLLPLPRALLRTVLHSHRLLRRLTKRALTPRRRP